MQDQEVDLARSTRWAWRTLHERLVERFELLEHGGRLRLAAPATEDEEGPTPYIVVRRDGDVLRAETSADGGFGAGRRLGEADRRQLLSIGWRRSASQRHYRLQALRRDVDRVAHACLTVFRDLHGVLHPAFLEGDVEPAEDPLLPRATVHQSTEPPVAAFPADRSELEAMVRATLAADLGREPKVDPDGDVPFCAGTAVVFVRVLDGAPVIRLFAELVVDIADSGRAAAEVERLNQEHSDVKFLLLDDRIHCERDVDAWPYVPQHLRSALSRFCDLCERIDSEAAERAGGRCFLDPPKRPPSYPPDLELLLSGDPPRTRPRAELISELCGEDVERLRHWLGRAYGEQEAAADHLQEAVATGKAGLVRARERDYDQCSRRYRRLARALEFALRQRRAGGRVAEP